MKERNGEDGPLALPEGVGMKYAGRGQGHHGSIVFIVLLAVRLDVYEDFLGHVEDSEGLPKILFTVGDQVFGIRDTCSLSIDLVAEESEVGHVTGTLSGIAIDGRRRHRRNDVGSMVLKSLSPILRDAGVTHDGE
jgi:hypothetical protein